MKTRAESVASRMVLERTRKTARGVSGACLSTFASKRGAIGLMMAFGGMTDVPNVLTAWEQERGEGKQRKVPHHRGDTARRWSVCGPMSMP